MVAYLAIGAGFGLECKYAVSSRVDRRQYGGDVVIRRPAWQWTLDADAVRIAKACLPDALARRFSRSVS